MTASRGKEAKSFETDFKEILNNIATIRGIRYALMLKTVFNIWSLADISVHYLHSSVIAEIVMEDTINSLVDLYFPDTKESIGEEIWNEIEYALKRDLKMLLERKLEFVRKVKT